jgi:mevalonate kinase
MVNFLTDNWQILAGLFGSVIAFFSGKKIKKAEENKSTSEALASMQQTYDTFVGDLRERYNELKEEMRFIKEQQLQDRLEIKELQNRNRELSRELKVWEEKYMKLKKEFETYKRENA